MKKRLILTWSVVMSMLALTFTTYEGSAKAFAASPATKIAHELSQPVGDVAMARHEWRVVASPNPGSNANNILRGLAALSANDIWAVGSYANGMGSQTLTEEWNGTRWSVVASPNAGRFSTLNGVAAVSANDVWAVGNYSDASAVVQTLIEQWNGTRWSVVPSPNPGGYSTLNGVAAVSANEVWAVGAYCHADGYCQALIEQWSGTRWSIADNPIPGTHANELHSVAAVSASDVWAVGDYYNANGDQTLTEHWNGSRWRIVPGPKLPDGLFYGMATVSANDIWAVGYAGHRTLIEHWNGKNWRVVHGPSPGTYNDLFSVAAVSANDIWAVGAYIIFNTVTTYKTLIEHWDGRRWSRVMNPNPGALNDLYGVAAISASDIWTVGDFGAGYHSYETLTEHYE